jgi:DNA mismatch endonuclease, patch repair protein
MTARASGRRRSAGSMDRSAVMRAVKSQDTGPERALRKMLYAIAPGYRLQRGDLPGKPDIVYGPRRLAVFMHGCFWHGHDCKRGARVPKNNAEYWRGKIARNRARDKRNVAALATLGWRTLTIFECELKDERALSARLKKALARSASPASLPLSRLPTKAPRMARRGRQKPLSDPSIARGFPGIGPLAP